MSVPRQDVLTGLCSANITEQFTKRNKLLQGTMGTYAIRLEQALAGVGEREGWTCMQGGQFHVRGAHGGAAAASSPLLQLAGTVASEEICGHSCVLGRLPAPVTL